MHKMEADALKNEIEDMVADMLMMNDGKDANNQKSSRSSKNSKKDKKSEYSLKKKQAK